MNHQSCPVITIDGPSGSGKGAMTHRLAEALGFHILDSGALYRLIGLAGRLQDIDLDDEAGLAKLAAQMNISFEATGDAEEPVHIMLEGEDVTLRLRTDEAGRDASQVAAYPAVRDAITQKQQDFLQAPGLVADGRDMGTVVFPGAAVKIYLTASAEVRAERRHKQLIGKGIDVSLRSLFQSIQARDDRDMNRSVSPLRPAEDAIFIDSTELSIEQVFAQILGIAKQALK